MHTFGIHIPKSKAKALAIDKENRNKLWMDAIQKEMTEALVACVLVEGCMPKEVQANKVGALRGYQEIKCHIIFDVKMDFTRQACFVAGEHMMEHCLT